MAAQARDTLARCVAVALLALRALPVLATEPTALDRYVAAPDPSYRCELLTTFGGDGAEVLRMTSQQWRSPAEVDTTL